MPFPKRLAWWALPTSYKQLLQQRREEGEFGGGQAVGAGRAPYFWSQEFGNPAANITPQHFITGPTGSLARFHSEFVRIMTRGVTT